MITLDQFQKLTHLNNQALVDAINATMERFDINTQRRIRYFMTQAYHETMGFLKFEENMNYRAERIVAVWPTRFTLDPTKVGPKMLLASNYAGNPQELANAVYANRNGNGDASSGDGWRYRGRGGFHLTFAQNYEDYSKFVYGDDRCVVDPDMVARAPDAMLSAGHFWMTRKLNELADRDEFTEVTKRIQGSDVTVRQRLEVLKMVKTIF